MNGMSSMFVSQTGSDSIKSSAQVKVGWYRSATCCLMHREPSEGNMTDAANSSLEPLSLWREAGSDDDMHADSLHLLFRQRSEGGKKGGI